MTKIPIGSIRAGDRGFVRIPFKAVKYCGGISLDILGKLFPTSTLYYDTLKDASIIITEVVKREIEVGDKVRLYDHNPVTSYQYEVVAVCEDKAWVKCPNHFQTFSIHDLELIND